jgi:hypothetical protein
VRAKASSSRWISCWGRDSRGMRLPPLSGPVAGEPRGDPLRRGTGRRHSDQARRLHIVHGCRRRWLQQGGGPGSSAAHGGYLFLRTAAWRPKPLQRQRRTHNPRTLGCAPEQPGRPMRLP